MNCCVFTNEKGGVGKTTATTIIGLTLAKRGKKVLIIDMDGQCNTTSVIMNTNDCENNAMNMLIDDYPVEQCIHSAKGLDLIPAHYELKNLDIKLTTDPKKRLGAPSLLASIIRPIKDSYDYILIDTPPAGGMVQLNALMLADKVIIPAVPEGFAYVGLADLFGTIKSVQSHRSDGLPTIEGVLFTRVRVNTTLHKDGMSFLQEKYEQEGIKLLSSTIRDSIIIPSSQIMGFTPQELDGSSAVAKDCENLVDEFVKIMNGNSASAKMDQGSAEERMIPDNG